MSKNKISRLPFRMPDWRGWVLPVLLIAAWHLTARSGLGNTHLIATPAQVWATALKQLSNADFPFAVLASLARDLSGFVLGTAAGLAFGVWVGLSKWAERLFLSTFHAVRQIALFAWIPLISIWIGYSNSSRILLISLSVFYPVALATFDGVRSVSLSQIEVARILEFSRWQTLSRVIAPASLPYILSGVNIALIYAWLATIGAEYLLPIYGSIGLGDTVIRGRAAFRVDLILFSMIAIGFIGWLINLASRRLERFSVAHRPLLDGGNGVPNV